VLVVVFVVVHRDRVDHDNEHDNDNDFQSNNEILTRRHEITKKIFSRQARQDRKENHHPFSKVFDSGGLQALCYRSSMVEKIDL
jgi:hypothetical protein